MNTTDINIAHNGDQPAQSLITSPPNTPVFQTQIRFECHFKQTGSLKLTSSELIGYPELTQQLRDLRDFPLLIHNYPINLLGETQKRSHCLNEFIRNCFNNFNQEAFNLEKEISQRVSEFGRQRKKPIIDSFQINTQGWVTQCIINGLPWWIDAREADQGTCADTLDLHDLFSINRQWEILVEDAIPGSPLLALCILNQATDRKRRVFWYNIDTRQPGQLVDAVRD